MSDEKRAIKRELIQACAAFAEARLQRALDEIKEAKEAAAGETKSSAGDKYETGRAMAQLAEERAQGQRAEALKLMEGLHGISADTLTETVQKGALIIARQGNYFIGISAGKLTIGDTVWFAVSPVAPIAKALWGAKGGDQVSFQGRNILIKEVY